MKNCSVGDNNNKKKTVNLEITSIETIKPASPTPRHLRNYNLSYFDQWFYDCYTPLIIFFPNKKNKACATKDVVKHLKQTLSQILTRFYPLAREVKDDLHIECNDKGVIFTEARVNHSLEEVLRQPDDEKMRELLPESPKTGEPSIGNFIIGVQVNTFICGGIGLSTNVTHKIFDGHTYFLFMKEWAAAARALPVSIPSFSASEVFPNNPSQNYFWPSKFTTPESSCTKRFVFDGYTLASLKSQMVPSTIDGGPTRMEATTALLWKAAAKASSTIRTFDPQSPHALFSYVNFRKRASPPLPYTSIGNLVRTATGICYPERKPDLPTLVREIRESIAKINSDHIESLKGEKGHDTFNEIQKRLKDLMDVTEAGDNCLFVTSLLNNGIYDVDFGWGKPIWFYDMNAGFTRIVALTDTLKGDGVEAIVTLTSSEMEIFEQDPELLPYAAVNPTPLRFIDD